MLAYQQSWKRKLIWIILGLLLLYTINQLRIGLFLVAINKGWKMPLGWDHHTWFNIVAYGAILIMLFFLGKAGNNFTAKN
jgi:exosortase/archaeosortase family protein